jgi:hypothetical protein
MERITLTRTATSEAAPSSLRITIRVKPRPVRVALLSLGIVLWGFGAASVFFFPAADAAASRSPLDALLEAGVLAFVAVGVLLMGHLAWILFGRETYEISPRALCVRRSIGPFAMRRTYRFADMQDARIIPGKSAAGVPPWKLMCLETERETIVLRHRERYVRLARDLDKAEGAYLLTAIRLWMQDR